MPNILFVDDDPVVMQVYTTVLTRNGFAVTAAADGIAGIQALNASKFDLLVLDLMMPKLDGVQVLKYIRSQPKLAEMPIIVLSNRYAGDLTEEAASFDVDQALLKISCSPASLVEKIRQVLGDGAAKGNSSDLLVATLK